MVTYLSKSFAIMHEAHLLQGNFPPLIFTQKDVCHPSACSGLSGIRSLPFDCPGHSHVRRQQTFLGHELEENMPQCIVIGHFVVDKLYKGQMNFGVEAGHASDPQSVWHP